MMEMKNHYETPLVDCVEIQSERIFADSLTAGGEDSGWEYYNESN